jgi:hypothetical protein
MATSTSKPSGHFDKHPLIGKLIMLDSEDRQSHTVSRFTAEIGPGLMLARRLNPRTGKDFAESHMIVLAEVAQDEWTMIFDDWPAYQRFGECPHEDQRVVKLVLKAPPTE